MGREYRRRLYGNYVSNHLSHTRVYDKRMYEMIAVSLRKLYSAHLPADKNAAILDVGCGAGEFLYMLRGMGYSNAVGVESGAEQIAIASNVGIQNIVKADIFEFMEGQNGCYDIITAHDVIEHLDRDECFLFLDMCTRALREGGRILVSTINTQSLFGARMRYSDLTHETGFTPGSLAQLLSSADFEQIHVYEKPPQVTGVRGLLRLLIWKILRKFLQLWLKVEEGTGHGCFTNIDVYTEAMFATATRKKGT